MEVKERHLVLVDDNDENWVVESKDAMWIKGLFS